MRRVVLCAAAVVCFATFTAARAEAGPITLVGTILDPGAPGYAEISAVLGASPGGTNVSTYSMVAFDLASLTFDPTAVLLVDDGLPLGDDYSALAGTGLDIDAAGGLGTNGNPSYATGVHAYVPGIRISAAADATLAMALETYVNNIVAVNDPSQLSTADPNGTGGPGYLFGVGSYALGAPDGFIFVGGQFYGGAAGYVSIGGGGQLSLLFANPINHNGNIGGTIYDFVYYDIAGANENGTIIFDNQPIAPVPEPLSVLMIGSGLAFVAAQLRRRRRRA